VKPNAGHAPSMALGYVLFSVNDHLGAGNWELPKCYERSLGWGGGSELQLELGKVRQSEIEGGQVSDSWRRRQ
jgi:hypothetical protein